MVSFQCHACGDVVKKPKLDQHHRRCHAGFDCIDCSTTFNSPAEYKHHTSCITEAEKYQKSLYRGPKRKDSSFPNGHAQGQSDRPDDQAPAVGTSKETGQPKEVSENEGKPLSEQTEKKKRKKAEEEDGERSERRRRKRKRTGEKGRVTIA